MTKITKVIGREILDSRGNPTIEVDILLDDGSFGRASAPSGASTGSMEAVELRDLDQLRFLGKGVLKAVNNVNEIISKEIIGKSPFEQETIDNILIELDGTNNKSKLGANAILASSLAVSKAAAKSKKIPLFQYIRPEGSSLILPKTFMNIINGGAHASNKLDIQEFMIIPHTNGIVKESVRIGAEIFHTLKQILTSKGYNTSVGDEGGFAPEFEKSEQALDFILTAIERAGYTAGKDVALALDCAASEFYKDGIYFIDGKKLGSEELIQYYKNLVETYPIKSIEDPMSEYDLEGWKLITKELGNKIMLVGDDLFVTNKKILEEGIKNHMANSILIKPNQIGTLSETMATIATAKAAGYKCILSHRSGETEDTSIAHIAVATGVGYIKTGSLSRSDRLAKYNELIRIEEILNK